MIKYLLSFAMLVFVGAQLYAQQAWTIYNNVNSPLPENSVRCIAFAPNGVKWIGTDYGLASFDGTTWNVYKTTNSGIPDNAIRSLVVDNQNNVWIGTFTTGLVKFDGINWTTYSTFNSDIPDDFVRSLALDTLGNLWVGTIGGLGYFDGTTWIIYDTSNSILISNNISALHVDESDNSLSIGTINGGIVLKDGNNWTHLTLWNSNLPDNTTLGIDKDTTDVRWLATPAGGLSGYISGITFVTFNTTTSTIASNSFTSIAVAADQSIWVGSIDSGVVKREGTNFINYNILNSGMPDNLVQAIEIDDQGIIWIGTQIGGLVRLDESLLSSVNSLAETSSFNLFPVPAGETLYMNSEIFKPLLLEVYDMSGKQISLQTSFTEKNRIAIQTSELSTGTYLVKVVFENGTVGSKFFVVGRN